MIYIVVEVLRDPLIIKMELVLMIISCEHPTHKERSWFESYRQMFVSKVGFLRVKKKTDCFSSISLVSSVLQA